MICLKCHQKKSLFFNGIRRTSDGCTGFTHFVLDIPRQISLYKNNVSNDCVVINSRNRKPEQLRENNLFITIFRWDIVYFVQCTCTLQGIGEIIQTGRNIVVTGYIDYAASENNSVQILPPTHAISVAIVSLPPWRADIWY